ncbi:unnamed protein product [Brachionus calyciflorus]|uniref:Uncharacterized protein n=1 Tax=Brachionus calyciflorus TaxID=104777 RepID=A0A813N606_9BILA|nr:unnamed protein product [Brachionus calyciflorus]
MQKVSKQKTIQEIDYLDDDDFGRVRRGGTDIKISTEFNIKKPSKSKRCDRVPRHIPRQNYDRMSYTDYNYADIPRIPNVLPTPTFPMNPSSQWGQFPFYNPYPSFQTSYPYNYMAYAQPYQTLQANPSYQNYQPLYTPQYNASSQITEDLYFDDDYSDDDGLFSRLTSLFKKNKKRGKNR